MSTGYEGVVVEDFSRYFSGGIAWHYRDGEVTSYIIGDISEEYDGELAEKFSVIMDSNKDELEVEVRDLFHSREWVIHRFPVLYVPIQNNTALSAISLEPRHSRMRKSACFSNMIRLQPVQTTLPSNLTFSGHVSVRDARSGLERVLSYGNHTLFPNATRWKYDSTADVLALFDPDTPARVVVPESHTAFVSTEDKSTVMILHSANILGKIVLEEGEPVLYSSHHLSYEEGLVRNMICEGLALMFERLVKGVKVIWETN
jgi:hypothetical protein